MGEHTVIVDVTLDRYRNIRQQTTFTLEILPCQVQTLTAVEVDDQTYNIFEDVRVIELPQFI